MFQNRGKRTDIPAFAIFTVESCTSREICLNFSLLGSICVATVNVDPSLPAPVWAESPVRMVAKNASVLKRGFA